MWVTPVILLLLLSSVVVGVATNQGPPGAGGATPTSSGLRPALTFGSGWVVTGQVTETDVAILVVGSVSVTSGASLTLTRVTLTISESSDLADGVVVQPQGSLIATSLTLQTSSPAGHVYHTYLRASAGSTVRLTGGSLLDLGGNVGGRDGFDVYAAGTVVTNVTFDQYYQAIRIKDAPNVHLSGITLKNGTGATSTYAVSVSGSSSGFTLRNSRFTIPQDMGALDLESPNAQVTGNQFKLDTSGTIMFPILMGFQSSGSPNAGGTYFANNTVNGAGIIDLVGSNVTIIGNTVENTGINRPYGILASVPVGTTPGLWVRGLAIENNYVTNFSRYGIRLELNVSNFIISGNTITHPSPNPGPRWTVKFGGPQIDMIYIIRGISDGTISHNYIDATDVPKVASDGISIESNVKNVKVTYNTIINMTQAGVMVQGNVPGFDNALPWERGPSTGVLIANNVFDNEQFVRQTNFTFKGVLLWLWANHTTVQNNTFIGFQNTTTSGKQLNGAAVLSSGSLNLFENNTVYGARYGFVFTEYSGVPHPYVGEFNRSGNVVFGNRLFDITQTAVLETPKDGAGPLHNVIVALTNTKVGPGVPTSYTESIQPATAVTVSQDTGTYTESLKTADPIGGGVRTFATSMPWTAPSFNFTSNAALGTGLLDVGVTSLGAQSVTYQVPATGSGPQTIDFDPAELSFHALYSVKVTTNSSSSSFNVNSTLGPAVFPITGGRQTTVRTTLVSWGLNSPPTTYEITFSETGLPSGTDWSVVLGSTPLHSTTPSVVTSLANGTWAYTIPGVGTYAAVLAIGNVTVAGASVGVAVTFTPGPPHYAVTFSEVGLISGTNWSVTVGDWMLSSTNSTVEFSELNGSYSFTVGPISGGTPTPWFGTLTVNGLPENVAINWTFSPPPTNNTTVRSTTWAIIGSAALPDGTPVARLTVALQFAQFGGGSIPLLAQSSVGGGFTFGNLSFAGNLSSIAVAPSNFSIVNFTATALSPDVLQISITVTGGLPANTSVPLNSTGPSPGGRGNATTQPPADPVNLLPGRVPATPALLAILLTGDILALGGCLGLLGVSVRNVGAQRRRSRARRSRSR
jgi:Right handed beta helix region